MRVAVIGAGVAGLVAGYRLAAAGHSVDVLERWPGLGGQAATLDVGGGVLLERYYHHWFTSDRLIAELYDELGLGGEIEWLPSSVAMFSGGRQWPFTSPVDLLRFRPLPFWSRVRLGRAVLRVQRGSGSVAPFEAVTAREWVVDAMGQPAWDFVWGPLLRGKFGDRADDISAAWLWGKLSLRRQVQGREARQELLGYPRGSFEGLFQALAERIVALGGRVLIDRPAQRVALRGGGGFSVWAGEPGSFRRGLDPRSFSAVPGEPERYDAVLATVPSDVFLQLLDDDLADALGSSYVGRLEATEYQAALCLVLELDRRFSPFYWTNIADPEMPFIGLVEQGNLVGTERYGGRHFLYVANYVAHSDPLLALDADALLERYRAGLTRVNPEFDPSWVRASWLFREPAAQPVVTVGYQDRIPPLDTGVPGLVLANTTQIYPEDRGTNYAVRLGDEAASVLLATARTPIVTS